MNITNVVRGLKKGSHSSRVTSYVASTIMHSQILYQRWGEMLYEVSPISGWGKKKVFGRPFFFSASMALT